MARAYWTKAERREFSHNIDSGSGAFVEQDEGDRILTTVEDLEQALNDQLERDPMKRKGGDVQARGLLARLRKETL